MKSNFQDSLNLFRKSSPRRALNYLRVLFSFYKSRKTGRPQIKGLPFSLSIEPTTSCNLRCPECPSGLRNFTRPTGMLEMDLYIKIIDELYKDLSYLTIYFQGEPFLHKGFYDIISYAHKKRIYTATSTNAHFLNDESAKKTIESGLDRMIISIDGTDQESYAQYRVGGELSKVIEGTKKMVEWKKKLKSTTPYLVFQFLVVKPNEHQIDEVKQLAKEIGVDHVAFKSAQVYDFENGNELIPTIDKYSRYQKGENGKWSIKNSLDNGCWKMWHSAVVTWDGQVVPCCFDKDAKYPMGSLQTQSFKEIWNSPTYTNFRGTLIKSRSSIEMCQNCTEGTKVWVN